MLIPLLITFVFTIIHISTTYLKVLDRVPRSKFLSTAGGVAVSYVFIHILPELSENQETIEELLTNNFLLSLESHIYVISLLGLTIFYGLERMSKLSKEKKGVDPAYIQSTFWIHLVSTAIYNTVTGYLLVNRERESLASLLLYGTALGLHFFVVDQGLRVHYKGKYDKYGRWVLSLGSITGFLLGYAFEINQVFMSALFAFLAGGIILNILKEELPEQRKSSFTAFASGVVGYSILLLLT